MKNQEIARSIIGILTIVLLSILLLECASTKTKQNNVEAIDSLYTDTYKIVKSGTELEQLDKLTLPIGKTESFQDVIITHVSDSIFFVQKKQLVIKKTVIKKTPFIEFINNKKADFSLGKTDNSIKKDQKKITTDSGNKTKTNTDSGNKFKFNFPWWIILVIIAVYIAYRYFKSSI